MDKNENALDLLRKALELKALDAWVVFTDAAALNSAAMLIEDTQISDPIEQVKYLYYKHYDGSLKSPMLMNISWTWLCFCIKEGKITVLPKEDWVVHLFLERARFIKLPYVEISKFLQAAL